MQAGGRRFEPVHLHQSCKARLVGVRRNAVSPKASTTDESAAFIARRLGLSRRQGFATANPERRGAESPASAVPSFKTRQRNRIGPEAPVLGGRGRLLIENREEASCVTEAEASAERYCPRGYSLGCPDGWCVPSVSSEKESFVAPMGSDPRSLIPVIWNGLCRWVWRSSAK